ncbi:MAG: hypothetical protein K9K36_13890 [Desulfarculaceae bacterium]|nr:hypothetical protein [Desulfarculaceae bacterium]MCF8066336.1 hypothetical protein [Desulfarculaceae bacterium]
MRSLLITMSLLLALGIIACRNPGVSFSIGASGPNVYEGVYDMPCTDVQQYVRDRLKQDPDLGLGEETKEKDAVAFKIPERWEGDLNWKATVTVQCTGKLSSTISSRIWAQHRVQGGWEQVNDTTKIESMILKKVTPKH